MKNHWRHVHQWTPGRRGGRISIAQRREMDTAITQSYRHVLYQQVFRTLRGSHFIRIEPRNTDNRDEEMDLAENNEFAQFMREAEQRWLDHQQQETETVIQAGEHDEANPWLRRTGWAVYLADMDANDLRQCIQQPVVEEADHHVHPGPGPATDEATAHAIWQAMDQVARVAQQTVTTLGHSIRVEAVRTEKDQNRHTPLQAYMNEEDITEHVRPWQQVLMFFARTQVAHEWASPVYRLTPRQRKSWRYLWRLASEAAQQGRSPSPDPIDEQAEQEHPPELTLSKIQQACLEFCIELLNQKAQGNDYDCAMVCALAVLGRGERGWRTVEDYPPLLSRLIKIARFIVVYKAVMLDPEALQLARSRRRGERLPELAGGSAVDEGYGLMADDEGYASDTPASPAIPSSPPTSPLRSSDPQPVVPSMGRLAGKKRSLREWLGFLVDSFMVRGSHSPMQWMLDLRTYGMKIHYSNTTPGHVGWTGPDQLLYKDLQFSIGDFRGFVHGLVGAARKMLREDILLGDQPGAAPIPAVPWSSMRDDPTQSKAGWNFLQDTRTRWPVDGPTWMWERLRQEPWVQRRFWSPRQGDRFRAKAVDTYINTVSRFREKLGVLVHITSGQPARAPELLSIRHINTENVHRNIFIEDGLVAFVTRYHKGFYASNDAKVIHRYVPREVGELVVWYLWLAIPFEQRLRVQQSHTIDEAGARASRSREACVWGPDTSGREWSSERFRRVLQRESRIGLQGQALNLHAYRDIAIGISRKFMRPSSQFPENRQEGQDPIDHEEESNEPEDWLGQIADFQAGHSAHVAGMIYARGIMEQSGVAHDRREKYRVSSTDWHRFLGFMSANLPESMPESSLGKRRRAPWETDAEEGRTERRWRLRQTEMEAALQSMIGRDTAQFRGMQAPAMRAIQNGDSMVVAVMPTGSGKSMLFMLPAWIEPGGTTIVVVPLIALRADMQQRCMQCGISCVEWESRRPPDEASIVLVTPESALSRDFITFVNRLRVVHRLDRIVIDECHIVLNDQADFRPQMQRLGQLMAAKTQIVLLTATLPPTDEEALFQRMRCRREDVSMFRARTSRRNIAYRVVRPVIEDRQHANPRRWIQAPDVAAFIQDRVRRARPGKVVVYAQVVGHAIEMAEILGCEPYYHNQVDKAGILERFISGDQPVVVATSAMGMGLDIPDIRSIIHLGIPRSLRDYAQESGRAGRDGKPSEAITVVPVGMDQMPPWFDGRASSLLDQERVRRYIHAGEGPNSPRCRRIVLDEYLDGIIDGYVRQCCGDQDDQSREEQRETACDGCRGDWEADESVPSSPSASDRNNRTGPVDSPIDKWSPAREWRNRPSSESVAGRSSSPPAPVFSPAEWLQQVDSAVPESVASDQERSSSDSIDHWRMQDDRFVVAIHHGDSVHSPRSDRSSLQRETLRMQRAFPDEFDITDGIPPGETISPVPGASDKGDIGADSISPVQRRASSVSSHKDSESIQSQPPISRPAADNPSVTYRESTMVNHGQTEQARSASINDKSTESACSQSPTPKSSRPAAEWIPPDTIQQFREQDMHRGRFIESYRQQGQREMVTEEFLEEQVRQWREQCWICEVHRRPSDHELYHCGHEDSQVARDWMIQVRRQVRYERYSGCFQCGMPQSICTSWQDRQPCAFRGILIPMIAMMLFGPFQAQIADAWRRRLGSFGVESADFRQVVAFLGQRVRGSTVEHNQVVESFCWLRRICMGFGV